MTEKKSNVILSADDDAIFFADDVDSSRAGVNKHYDCNHRLWLLADRNIEAPCEVW